MSEARKLSMSEELGKNMLDDGVFDEPHYSDKYFASMAAYKVICSWRLYVT